VVEEFFVLTELYLHLLLHEGECGSVVGRGAMLQASRTIYSVSIRNLPWGKELPARKADDLTAISGPII
jgi:hypothetical protein